MKLTAKVKKNQANLNRAISWLLKHNEANTLRDKADDMGDDKAYNKADRQCERTFDKYLEYCSELPKYEVARIEKSEIY